MKILKGKKHVLYICIHQKVVSTGKLPNFLGIMLIFHGAILWIKWVSLSKIH